MHLDSSTIVVSEETCIDRVAAWNGLQGQDRGQDLSTACAAAPWEIEKYNRVIGKGQSKRRTGFDPSQLIRQTHQTL